MPLQRRLPKFGFQNINRVEYKAINLSLIQSLADKLGVTKIGLEELRNAGFINKKHCRCNYESFIISSRPCHVWCLYGNILCNCKAK